MILNLNQINWKRLSQAKKKSFPKKYTHTKKKHKIILCEL